MVTPAHADLTGKIIASQFRVVRTLGRGGMGTVYLAEQLSMERAVVLKVLHPELHAGSPGAAERFKREARAIARLNHPHIVQVFVFGEVEESGQLYLVMEFVEGRTLGDELERRAALAATMGGAGEPVGGAGEPAGASSPVVASPQPVDGVDGERGPGLPMARVLRVADQICSALVEAHGAGLVHRDLKPENVMLTERHGVTDYVKVLDFGIARLLGEDEGRGEVTVAGQVFGTPRYMSPEQARGDRVDARSDLYSLGVMLYELLSGFAPFSAASNLDYLLKHQTERVVPLCARFPTLNLSPRVEALVSWLLEKDAAARPQSAAELQREVRLAMRDLPDAGRAWPTPGPQLAVTADDHRVVPRAAGGEPGESGGATGPVAVDAGRGWARTGLAAGGAALAAAGVTLAVLALSDSGPSPETLGAAVVAPGARVAPVALDSSPRLAAAAEGVGPGGGGPGGGDAAIVEGAVGRGADSGSPSGPDPSTPPPDLLPAADDLLDGWPWPRGATIHNNQVQSVTYVVASTPQAVLAFYQHHLARLKVRGVRRTGSGLQINDPDAPFTGVWFTLTATELLVSLPRNPFAKKPESLDSGERVWGLLVPPDARVGARFEASVMLAVPGSPLPVMDFFEAQVAGRAGLTVTRKDEVPLLSVSAAPGAGTEWASLVVSADPFSASPVARVVIQRHEPK